MVVILGRLNDPHETTDQATKMPDVLHSLKTRFIELKATALDQKPALLKVAAATKRLTPNFLRMLRANDGFIGPWCTVRTRFSSQVVPWKDCRA